MSLVTYIAEGVGEDKDPHASRDRII